MRIAVHYLLAMSFTAAVTFLSACGPGYSQHAPAGDSSPFTISREDIGDQNPVLVTIDDTLEVRAEALLLRLEESNLLANGGLLSYEQIADTLEEIVLDSLLNFVVDTFDLHSDTAGWANYSITRATRLKNAVLEEKLLPHAKIDSQLVDSFYWVRPDIFSRKARIDVAHIVLSKAGYRGGQDSLVYRAMSDHDLDSLIDLRLNLLKKEIHDSLGFKEAAKLYSLDEVKGSLGGRLGWVQRYDLHPEVEDVLYDPATSLLTAVGPVESRDGSHLFFIYDRRAEGIPPLDSAMYQLAHGYLRDMALKKLAGLLVDSLRYNNLSLFNDSALLLSSDEADPLLWVAVTEGVDTVRYVTFERALIPFRSAFSGEFGLHQYRTVAQTVLDERMIIRYAIDMGLDTLPHVASAIVSLRHQYARDALNKSRYGFRYQPTFVEIAQYFENNPAEFAVERPFRIQQILTQDSMLAEFVSAQAESGVEFLDLAESYYVGEPDIRRAAADLGWIGPNDFAPEIYSVLDSLIVGDITPPIKTQYGFHVVRLLEKKPALSLAEAGPLIKSKLVGEHRKIERERWAKLLRKNRRITFHTAGMTGVRLANRELRLLMRQERLGVEPGKSFRSL